MGGYCHCDSVGEHPTFFPVHYSGHASAHRSFFLHFALSAASFAYLSPTLPRPWACAELVGRCSPLTVSLADRARQLLEHQRRLWGVTGRDCARNDLRWSV